MMTPRKQAILNGASRYFTGKPCANGHMAEHTTADAKCVECVALRRKQWWAANPDYEVKRYAADPDRYKERAKAWARNNPEKAKAKKKAWILAHPGYAKSSYWGNVERYREYAKKWARLNPEKCREKDKAWRAANPEYLKEYYWSNPERCRAYQRNRNAMKRNAAGKFTVDDVADILKAQRGKCAYCRKKLGDKYDVDHIVALARGGRNDRSNIQVTCPSCNRSKGARDPIDHARTMGMLL